MYEFHDVALCHLHIIYMADMGSKVNYRRVLFEFDALVHSAM
jgi:hypothetical protein